MKPEEYAALFKLEMLNVKDFISISLELIEVGLYSDALLELAWEDCPRFDDAAPIFEKGLKDIGLLQISKERSLVLLGNIYCKQILSGEITPYEGSRNIWNEICSQKEAPSYFFEFVSLSDALQNFCEPKEAEILKKCIIDEAKKVVARVNV
jgi:hypothetical protein